MQLLTNDAFLRLQLFLLSSSLFKFQTFHLLLALVQLSLQGLDVRLVVTVVVWNMIIVTSKCLHSTLILL